MVPAFCSLETKKGCIRRKLNIASGTNQDLTVNRIHSSHFSRIQLQFLYRVTIPRRNQSSYDCEVENQSLLYLVGKYC